MGIGIDACVNAPLCALQFKLFKGSHIVELNRDSGLD